MKYEAVTIKDIAKALGLSTSTVSRALRDSYEISPETKKLVMEYAEKINYQPNPIALSLKEKKSHTIGVIVGEIANSFFSQIINGIESVAKTRHYNVIISQSHESFDKEMSNLQYLTSRSIDGLLISVSAETTDFSSFKEISSKGMPMVFFDRIVDEIETHKVIADNFTGAYNATAHLIKKGYKRIATICNASILSIAKERLAGYSAALTDHGLPVDESLIRYCKHGGMFRDEMEESLKELFKPRKKPDAIFASSDKITMGCLRILRAQGYNIPGEIGLIGFSNGEFTELLDPPLSVIKQPAFEMGQVATELLLQLIESKRPVHEFETRVLSTEMIIRGSTL
ncbi:MAG: LacI family DNA-binding transcriptional regulator [Chitinophagaceae bacterium]